MADLSVAVEYDRVYPVVIRHPVTGEDEGVRVNVVSKDSRRVVEALRKEQGDYWSKLADGVKDAAVPDVERVVLINCIDSWDWAGSEFAHISGAGAASLDDRIFLIDHPNAKWFRDQLAAGTANLENFSQALPKIARRGLKKT